MQVEKPAPPRVPGVGQWFPPRLFGQVLRSRARLAALPLVLPGPLTHALRSTFAPLCGPSSPRTHRRAWNCAPRPGWRGCSSRRPHWGGGSGAQQSERTRLSANPGGPCPGLQHRNPAPPSWAGTRDTLPMVRPPTQVPCL